MKTNGANNSWGNVWVLLDKLFLIGFILAAVVQYTQHKYLQAIYFAIFSILAQLWSMEDKQDLREKNRDTDGE